MSSNVAEQHEEINHARKVQTIFEDDTQTTSISASATHNSFTRTERQTPDDRSKKHKANVSSKMRKYKRRERKAAAALIPHNTPMPTFYASAMFQHQHNFSPLPTFYAGPMFQHFASPMRTFFCPPMFQHYVPTELEESEKQKEDDRDTVTIASPIEICEQSDKKVQIVKKPKKDASSRD